MAGNSWKLLERLKVAVNCWKRLEMVGHGWNGKTGLKWLEKASIGSKQLELLKMAVNGWNWLYMAVNGMNCWK